MVLKSFTLQSGKSHTIEPGVGPNGRMEVLSFFPPLEGGIEATWFNIKDENGNILLHISLRPSPNAIVLNTMPVGKDWEKETHIPFKDNLPSSKAAKICILDRGDNYLVTFSDGAGTKFPKSVSQIDAKASSIEYLAKDERPILSNPVKVNVRYEDQPHESSASIHININLASSAPRNMHFEVNLG
ncbi:hypothetical protein RSAG8_02973, partial [Rhizoctonia solani AG-8 WAC10335]